MNKPNCCEKCSGTEEIHTCECHIVKTTTDTQVLEECKGNKACSKFMHISKKQECEHGGYSFGCAICFDAAVEKRIQQDRAYLAGEVGKYAEEIAMLIVTTDWQNESSKSVDRLAQISGEMHDLAIINQK